mmetsp:Transcript_6543/g.9540  ORF Transcript_6543/g.9540 Transcript_6543/m.9540 type:complete len:116 (-) Transcript_6543:386-733(-)
MRATDQDAVESNVTTFEAALCDMEEIIETPFVCGEHFSVADCIAAPWVQRFSVTIPHFRGIEVGAADAPKTTTWMKNVVERASVMETACPEDGMISAAQRFFVKFVSPGSPASKA